MKNKNQLCPQKDTLHRVNYLYQASRLMALKNRVAASYFGKNIQACCNKAQIRMEPNLKRTICKYCRGPLIPGETARVRLVSKPIKGIKWTCLTCMMYTKRYPTKKGYKLWLDQPESVVETLYFKPKSKETLQKPDSGDTPEKLKEQTELKQQTELKEQTKLKQQTEHSLRNPIS
ncbi:ribonuclease P protein subunit rpr2 isoform X1 [Solenopsis invicta]|uniref:ribonuclease P protein subunit rpr2 isoform X1 n=1 Tax=Solenopsis invicta TaxID=13686 RepID=UPI00193CEB29|nr:ribonuclease P protein subunit rpr2 isoform X1 [Solenopsis invicta]